MTGFFFVSSYRVVHCSSAYTVRAVIEASSSRALGKQVIKTAKVGIFIYHVNLCEDTL